MPSMSNCLTAIGIACALVSPASAQLLNQKSLSAAMAMTIAQTALETCTKQGYNVSVHVLGHNGEILVAVRGDGAPPHTMENSQRKAYTSRTFRIPSGKFEPANGPATLSALAVETDDATASQRASPPSASAAAWKRRGPRFGSEFPNSLE